MNAPSTTHGSGPFLLARLRRPPGIADGARWLFAALAILSLLLSLPDPLSAAGTGHLFVVVTVLTLTASCVYVYLSRRVPVGLDVVDTVAIASLALSCSTPATALGYLFASIWFRGLYGSTGRSLVRCGLYMVALASCLPLWTLVPGHTVPLTAVLVIGPFPLMLLTVVVARQLGNGLLAREQNLRRDAALALTGADLLGLTDIDKVRATSWAAAVALCAATPGLRIIRAVRSQEVFRVEGGTGGFATVPVTLPGGVITIHPESGGAEVTDRAPLDAAVGVRIEWACLGLTESPADVWLLVGAPKQIPDEAMLAVRSLVNQTMMAEKNCQVHVELTAQARIDSLTGLANRGAFTAELTAQVARRQGAETIQVLFLDLDDFKDVNDLLGHQVGDELLMEVAARIRRSTRPDDLCARLGGDEFAVMLRASTTTTEAAGIAQRLVDSIAEPIHLTGHTARVGASVGIAAGREHVDIEELVHHADIAMYAAKAFGKGRIQIFDPGLLRADATRLAFERELAAAASSGQLVVLYQPILSLPDLRCTAVEALVRWQHPELGLLNPGQFIEAAERTGSIIGIGDSVLRQACTDAAGWAQQFLGFPLGIHVNISARQFDEDRFIEAALGYLQEFRIPADQLVLELTETVVLDSPAAIKRVRSLAQHGVRFAIDDFGTGYSSLTALRSLPVDIIKLDTTFVAGAADNAPDRSVIEAIVQLSRKLGLATIAEGVERAEQEQLLQDIGTDAVQGFLYSRPLTAPELTAWLRTNLATESAQNSNVVPLRQLRVQA